MCEFHYIKENDEEGKNKTKMGDFLSFSELYYSYELCLKNKKKKSGTYNFFDSNLCQNLYDLLEEINNRKYVPSSSNCYVVKYPAYREIFAAQFKDRVVQHFYMNELGDILNAKLVKGCSSCIKNRGTAYALDLVKKYVLELSKNGTERCYYLKIDLSGYFMSIKREIVCNKFIELINQDYKGKHKELLLYLTPIIFLNNPADNCIYKCNELLRARVPNRRKMVKNSEYGMAIGNLTSQAGSNLNLNNFDHYVTEKLGLNCYVRYVDDIVIISKSKVELKKALPKIRAKLLETNQSISDKKTKIDTVYHGVQFVGKVTYPYRGYQIPSKQVYIRVMKRAKDISYHDIDSLISQTNSEIGFLKGYNCRKAIFKYADEIMKNTNNAIKFNSQYLRFEKKD